MWYQIIIFLTKKYNTSLEILAFVLNLSTNYLLIHYSIDHAS